MAGIHGFGAKFKLHNGTALTAVANVLAVKPPSPTVETIDVTDHDSAGAMREFIAGLIDTGAGTVRVHYLPGSPGDVLLSDDAVSRAVKAWSMEVDRKSVVSGKSVSVRVDLGGRRIIKNNTYMKIFLMAIYHTTSTITRTTTHVK